MSTDSESRGARSPEELFAILGHETRLAILYELWAAKAHGPMDPERDALSFAELRTRVGMRDGSQFNYHLKQLVGSFVRQTDDGYALRFPGKRIIQTVLVGVLTDEEVLDAEPIDDPCPLCGGPVVLDYGTPRAPDLLLARCTACDGAWTVYDDVSGVLSVAPVLWPAGARERSPTELYRAQSTWLKHRIMSTIEGACSHCSGPTTVTAHVCADHELVDGRRCPHCGTIFDVRFEHVCSVCVHFAVAPTAVHLLAHQPVAAFYHEHGYDNSVPWGHEWLRIETETIADQTVVSEDPLAIEVDVVADDDHLDVTLDGRGAVVDVRS